MDANGHKVMTIPFGSDEPIRMINQTPTPIQPYNNNSNISVLQLMQKKKEFTEEIYTKREFIALMNYYYMRLFCTS
jgi:hypothetical protein